jgi:hypothetical protein
MASEISFRQEKDRILIDEEPFEWELDEDAINEANRHAGTPQFISAIHNDIMGHFLDSLASVLGFRPSMMQVNESLQRGFITK